MSSNRVVETDDRKKARSPWKKAAAPAAEMATESWPALADAKKVTTTAAPAQIQGSLAQRKADGLGNGNPLNKHHHPHPHKPGPKRNNAPNNMPPFPVPLPYQQPVQPMFYPPGPAASFMAHDYQTRPRPFPIEPPMPVLIPVGQAVRINDARNPVRGDSSNWHGNRPHSSHEGAPYFNQPWHHQRPFGPRENMNMPHNMPPFVRAIPPFFAPVRGYIGRPGFPGPAAPMYYVPAPPPEMMRGQPHIIPHPHSEIQPNPENSVPTEDTLSAKILKQIEYYFSDTNLETDKYLHSLLDEQGCQASLFKLRQATSVEDYQSTFETLSNRINPLPPDAILHCFLSGLKPQIRNEVQPHQPTTLTTAIALAKLIESKLNDTKQFFKNTNNRTQPPLLSLPPIPNPTQNSTANYPIRRLTQTELQTRKAQGLCFYCDEKFSAGHKCPMKQALLLLPDDDLADHNLEPPTEAKPTEPAISFHALIGSSHPRSIRLKAFINNNPISILVDSGSSHNYIHPKVARFLNLKFEKTAEFQVAVGNGEKLRCVGACRHVLVQIGDYEFRPDFLLLPISGADAVFGIEWL